MSASGGGGGDAQLTRVLVDVAGRESAADTGGVAARGSPRAGRHPPPLDLSDADLRGVDLSGANLDGAHLFGARYDAHTRWPEGFDPVKRGAILIQ
jgi:uncharacterized protein YjbI with pentapeptide repeats